MRNDFHIRILKMAAVYKSLSKTDSKKADTPSSSNGVKKNKQRVLVLSSRGVTFRSVQTCALDANDFSANIWAGIAIS